MLMGFGVLGGAIAASKMAADGTALILSNRIADPADAIADELARAMRSAHGLYVRPRTTPVTASRTEDIAAAMPKGTSYALDVQTRGWGVQYVSTDWTRYRVSYYGVARLIDTETRKMVAEGSCTRESPAKESAPTYNELTANHAAILKKELALAASDCIATFKKEMLAL